MMLPVTGSMKKGFSLIELLVVILLVTIVYFLGFEGFEITKPKPKALTPMNLKTEILASEHFEGQATLLCVDKCRTCYIRPKLSSSFQTYDNPIDLKNIKAYSVDASDSLVPIEYGRYEDKKICLIMDFYSNGSSTQIILENEEGAYFLPAFFETAQYFKTPQEAKEYWVNKSHILSDDGAFY